MFLDKKGYSVKCKHRMRDSVTNCVGIQQFICLIGGRVCNPRLQHVVNIFRRYSKHAAAAGYKPAPQLGRQITI